MAIEINLNEILANAFNRLSNEQKKILAEESKKNKDFLDSIPDFIQDQKREFAKNFQIQL